MKALIPSIGVRVPVKKGQIVKADDQRTYMCRIAFDEEHESWVIASTFNEGTKRWDSILKNRRIGLTVFINDYKPVEGTTLESGDLQIVITSIHSRGTSVYADPV